MSEFNLTTVLVTGANAGLGKECSRQLALLHGVKKVYLGCRNRTKAEAAKAELEESTGKQIFEVLIIDVSNLASVRTAVTTVEDPLDRLVLNAGGKGGVEHAALTDDGVTAIIATNILGHVLLVDLLLEQKKLTGCVVLAGSELARGIPSMGLPKPDVKTGAVEVFTTICDVSFSTKKDFESMYGTAKLLGAFWMNYMAGKHPLVKFVSMSPGQTVGTEVMMTLPPIKKYFFMIMLPILQLFGGAHSMETGAKRYVDALTDNDTYKSGVFYASKKGLIGPTCDQSIFMEELINEQYQDNASAAIHKFIK